MAIENSNVEIKNSFEVLTPIIDKYLLAEHTKEQEKRAGKTEEFAGVQVKVGIPEKVIHPSWITESCWRKCFYKLNNYPVPPIRAELLKIFHMGDAIHEMIQGWLAGAGVLVKKELTLIDLEYNIRGRFDAVVLVDSVPYIVEIKSIKDEKLSGIIETDEPLLEHLKQLNLYMYMANNMKRLGIVAYPEDKAVFDLIKVPITKGILLYASKIYIFEKDGMPIIATDTKVEKEFVVDYNQPLVDGMLKKSKFIMDTNNAEFVDRGYDFGSKECYYCDYRVECWGKRGSKR